MDSKLRDTIRAHRQGSASREEVLRALVRAGITPDWLRDETHRTLHHLFVDKLDYDRIARLLDAADGAPTFVVGAVSYFEAKRPRGAVGIRVWWPSEDEVVAGYLHDLRFCVSAALRQRSEVIDSIQAEFPAAAVVSSAVAWATRPERPAGPIPGDDAAWPEESKRVHVRGR